MGLTLAMTLIIEFSRSYMILTIWWPRSSVSKDLPDSDRGDFRCRRAVDSSSFTDIDISFAEMRTSCNGRYLHKGISKIGKTVQLYWNSFHI